MDNGRYNGTVKDYGISETKAGDPQVFVAFDIDGHGSLTWFGSLKEGKAQEITLKGLLAAGFTGKDVSELLDGPDGGAIPLGTEVSLVIENEEYPAGSGTMNPRIRWVNKPGGGGVQRADAATAKAKLAKLGLAGKLAQVKAQNPDLMRDPF
jgi:hypothetical protein